MANKSSSRPIYERIYETLRDEIKNRLYKAGDRIPSEKELAESNGVSRITSKKVLELLANDGYILRQPGRGSFVADWEQGMTARHENFSPATDTAKHHRSRFLVGLVITDFSESYGSELIYGMETASRENEAFLVVRRSFGVPELEEKAIKGMLDLGVDGLIILPAQGEYFNAEILKLVINRFPVILIDRHLKGIAAGSVSTDNTEGAKKGTEYLFGLGHKHIAFLSPPPSDTTTIEDRIEGFVQAHAENGITVDRDLWLNDIVSTLPTAYVQKNRQIDIEKIRSLLKSNPHITAIFAVEYNIALLAAAAARDLGLKVPKDLSIMCFDCPDQGGVFPFTHVRQKQEEMGRVAFESVRKLKEGESVPNRINLDADLVLSTSTGPAQASR